MYPDASEEFWAAGPTQPAGKQLEKPKEAQQHESMAFLEDRFTEALKAGQLTKKRHVPWYNHFIGWTTCFEGQDRDTSSPTKRISRTFLLH